VMMLYAAACCCKAMYWPATFRPLRLLSNRCGPCSSRVSCYQSQLCSAIFCCFWRRCCLLLLQKGGVCPRGDACHYSHNVSSSCGQRCFSAA
jgi:hypothetical protein